MIATYLRLIIPTIVFLGMGVFLLPYPKKRWPAWVGSLLSLFPVTAISYWIIAGPSALWRYHFILAALNVFCFAAIGGYLSYGLFGKKNLAKGIFAVAGVLFLSYGMINMSLVFRHDAQLHSPKVQQEHRFAFLSDTHEESAQGLKKLEKVVAEINELDLEFVVLGGDITDDYTSKEEMENTYAILGKLTAPTYFVYGNHDQQGLADAYARGKQYTEEELRKTIEKNGICILKDEYVQLSDDLVIVGRYDRSYDRKEFSSIIQPSEEYCILDFEHQAIPFGGSLDNNADFQISGHTHGGQFWPMNPFYHIVGYNSYGFYSFGDTTLYISPGLAGWRVPFRTSAHCQYEILTLMP